ATDNGRSSRGADAAGLAVEPTAEALGGASGALASVFGLDLAMDLTELTGALCSARERMLKLSPSPSSISNSIAKTMLERSIRALLMSRASSVVDLASGRVFFLQ